MKTLEKMKATCILLGISMAGCGQGQSRGTFPSFKDIAADIGPVIKRSRASSLASDVLTLNTQRTAGTEWPKYAGIGALGDVLGPDEYPAPGTRIQVVLGKLDEMTIKINDETSDENGEPNLTKCSRDVSGLQGKVPFFDQSTTNSIVELARDKYTCFVQEGNSEFAFGREACHGGYAYHILTSYTERRVNTLDSRTRGQWVIGTQVLQGYYSECSKDFKLRYLMSTHYESGIQFNSRSEIEGNRSSHRFRMRTIKDDIVNKNGLERFYFTSEAIGQAMTQGENGYFAISYQLHKETKGQIGDRRLFCIQTGVEQGQYAAVSAGCENLFSDLEAIEPLTGEDVPRAPYSTDLRF